MKLTLCIDRQSRTTPSTDLREYEIQIGNPLRSYGDVFDELKIITDDNKKLVGTIVRRCEVDKYGVLKKLDNEEIQELILPEITLFEGDNYVYIKEYNDLNMKIQYLVNSEMNKHYVTYMELNSTIQETMDTILLEVSRKADSSEVSAMIKLLADKIALKVSSGDVVNALNISTQLIEIIGNRLKIDTDNFKLDPVEGAQFINGSINTDKDLIVGNNAYIGQNQNSNADLVKFLYFSQNAWIKRWIFPSGGNYLRMQSDLNTTIACKESGFVRVLEDGVDMSHSPNINSDKRLKDNIQNIDVSWINNLKIKEYEYKNTPNKKQIGLIAQDYLEEDFSKYFLNKNDNGYYAINYGNITNALIQYCQELNKRVIELERRCNNG